MMNFTAWHIFLGYSKKTYGVSWFEVSVENGHLEAYFCVGFSSHLCVCLSRSILKFCCRFWASTADVWQTCLIKEAIYPVPLLLLKFCLLQLQVLPTFRYCQILLWDHTHKETCRWKHLASGFSWLCIQKSQISRICSPLKAPSCKISCSPLMLSQLVNGPLQFVIICFELAFG